MRELQAAREEEERNTRRPEPERSHGYPAYPEDSTIGYQDPRDRFAPQPPERKSSYDIYGKNNSMSQLPPPAAGSPMDMGHPSRSGSSSLRQPEMNGSASAPGSAKKSVSFNANIVTEIHDTRFYGSTSSESSLNPQSPYAPASPGEQFALPPSSGYQSTPPSFSGAPPTQNSIPQQPPNSSSAPPSSGYSQAPSQRYNSQPYSSHGQYQSASQGGQYSQAPGQYGRPQEEELPPPPNMTSYPRGSSSGSSTSDAPGPFQRQFTGPNGPSTPQQGPNEVFDQRTPDQYHPPSTLVSGDTPGVVGAQEVYRDPRDRIAAQRQGPAGDNGAVGERMSFRDKMKMFAKEAGENTPNDKLKISRAQQRVEASLQSP